MVGKQERVNALPELFESMQKFFMKKEQQCGPLKYLQSRVTTDTSNNIDDIVQGILAIHKKYNILPEDYQNICTNLKTDSPVISSFQVMLMNTNFYSQFRLVEDTLHGHQVDRWPIISPYLFIQIVWGLRCEELLPRFVLYLPMELSIELLVAIVPCLAQLEFERVINLVVQLVNYIYKLIYKLGVTGTQIDPCKEHMFQLQANFQELLDQLSNPRLTGFADLSEQMRYERQGVILKSIVRMSKLCTTERMYGGVQEDSEKLYTLTFGNEQCGQVPPELLNTCIHEMDQSLERLLIKYLKEVTCHAYLAWAEVKDWENPLLTLQRAIITECVYFMKIVNTDPKLQDNPELRGCLNELIGSQNQPQLTLVEIYHGVQVGDLTDLSELLKRYHDWDGSTLIFIRSKQHMLRNEDFEVIFKYLERVSLMQRSTQEEKLDLQFIIMNMLLRRGLSDIYEITLSYVMHHYRDNFFRNIYNINDFYILMGHASGLWHDSDFLKTLLIHILHSPKEVLRALIHMAVDVTDGVACTAEQLLILRPFLYMKIAENQSLLTDLLYQMCAESQLWNLKKYTHFITVMLKNFVTTPEDMLSNVFIRYMMEQPFDQNVTCILTSVCRIVDGFNLKSGVVELCLVMARKISNWRKCEPSKKRGDVNELLSILLHVLRKCVRKPSLMTIAQKRHVLDTVLPHIEPLDKAAFSPLLYLVQNNVLSIVEDYARRCYAVRRKHKLMRRDVKEIYDFVDNVRLQKEDFVRHMMLHAIEIEYQENCLDLITKYWFFFGWLDEIDAFDNVTRITMEAVRVGLEYPGNVPFDSFRELLKNCMQLSDVLSLQKMQDQADKMMYILLKNMSLVLESTQCMPQWETYGTLIKKLEEMAEMYSLQKFIHEVDKFVANMSIEEYDESNPFADDILPNPDVSEMFDSYKFVCGCFSIPGTEKHHRFVEKLEEILFNEELGALNYHPL